MRINAANLVTMLKTIRDSNQVDLLYTLKAAGWPHPETITTEDLFAFEPTPDDVSAPPLLPPAPT